VGQVQVPICHLGGWFDNLVKDTLAAFTAMQGRAATAEARKGQRLIVGPWVHGPMNTHGKPVGLLEFGPNAKLDFNAFRQRWYDAQLGEKDTLENDPVVWLYLTGPDRWLGFDSWPPPQMKPTPWYVHTNLLAEGVPEGDQEPDVFEYDPDDPVPTLAGEGAMGMGLDQRSIEERLLAYTSLPLEGPLTLVGPVTTVLHAGSSARDTDWVAKLTMVRPDGASVILTGGVLRARFRHSLEHPEMLEPNQPERFEIRMLPISIVIPAGHRLRLTVTSSDFPAFDRNLNTGGPIGQEQRGQKAINTIYHDSLLPSHVLLPVLAGSDES
jgi:putative CocE/NonD family hydrolase